MYLLPFFIIKPSQNIHFSKVLDLCFPVCPSEKNKCCVLIDWFFCEGFHFFFLHKTVAEHILRMF